VARTAKHTQFHFDAPRLNQKPELAGSRLADPLGPRRAALSADSRQTDLEQMQPRHSVHKPVFEPLDQFIRRTGGINACAALGKVRGVGCSP
jgi:hypothetical protein